MLWSKKQEVESKQKKKKGKNKNEQKSTTKRSAAPVLADAKLLQVPN